MQIRKGPGERNIALAVVRYFSFAAAGGKFLSALSYFHPEAQFSSPLNALTHPTKPTPEPKRGRRRKGEHAWAVLR